MIDASCQHQQNAPAMGQTNLKLRVPVEHAAENEVACGDGGVKRKAQDVRKIEWRGTLSTNYLQRMQKYWKVQGFDARKNRPKQRVVQITMVDVGAHVNAAYARQFTGAIQFVDGAIRKEHGKREQSEQPRRVLEVRSASCIVPCARQSVGYVFVAPVSHWPGQGHGLHGRALRVHIRDSFLQIDKAVRKWSLKTHVGFDVEAFLRCAIFHIEARPFFREDVKISLREIVGVNIDRVHTGNIMIWHDG